MLPRLILLALMVPGLLLALPVSAAQAQEEKAPLVRHFQGEKGEVPASEIAAAMREGRAIDIDNARITGKLELRGGSPYRKLPIAAKVSITSSQFEGDVVLSFVDFEDYTIFRGASFQGYASFQDAIFQGDASFGRASFQGYASFQDATFQGDVSFTGGTDFQGDASFSGASFQGYASFSGASFQGDARFYLTVFASTVNLSHVAFARADVRWKQLEGRLAYDEWAYASLIRNFENLGLYEDADNAYYDYMTRRRDKAYPFYHPQWLVEFVFLDLSCGYGVKPFRAIVMALALIVFFTAFYYRRGAIASRESSGNAANRGRWARAADALYFSVTTFTTLGYGDWYPVGRYRMLAMLESLTGWLLLALFLVTLGRVWIR